MKLIDKIEDFLEEGGGFKTSSSKNLEEGTFIHIRDAILFMKDIKYNIDKSIKELENDGDIYDNGAVTPYLVMRMLDIKKYSWYKKLFYK